MTASTDVSSVFATVHAAVAWLDTTLGRTPEQVTNRVLQLAQETGEVAEAWAGTTGANPRKGPTHTRAHVTQECADVAMAALVIIASLDYDPAAVLVDNARRIAARLPNHPPPP